MNASTVYEREKKKTDAEHTKTDREMYFLASDESFAMGREQERDGVSEHLMSFCFH